MLHSILGRTLLVAAALTQTNAEHPHEHDKEECACAQHETDHPFTIDCANVAAIRAATVTLESTCKANNAGYEWGGAFATPNNAYKWVAQVRKIHRTPCTALQPPASSSSLVSGLGTQHRGAESAATHEPREFRFIYLFAYISGGGRRIRRPQDEARDLCGIPPPQGSNPGL